MLWNTQWEQEKKYPEIILLHHKIISNIIGMKIWVYITTDGVVIKQSLTYSSICW